MNHKKENVFRENNFIIYSETKVIINTKKQLFEFFLKDISNVRILKRRNLYPNIIAFYIILIITSASILTTKTNDIFFFLINIFIVLVLLIITFSLKKYNHMLLINKGKYGFSEIILHKENIQNANKFLNDFNSNKILKFYPENSENNKFKECI
jgi:hypothetical protein